MSRGACFSVPIIGLGLNTGVYADKRISVSCACGLGPFDVASQVVQFFKPPRRTTPNSNPPTTVVARIAVFAAFDIAEGHLIFFTSA